MHRKLWRVTSAHQEELLQTMATTYPNFCVFLDKLKLLTGVLEQLKGQDGGGEEEDLKY